MRDLTSIGAEFAPRGGANSRGNPAKKTARPRSNSEGSHAIRVKASRAHIAVDRDDDDVDPDANMIYCHDGEEDAPCVCEDSACACQRDAKESW